MLGGSAGLSAARHARKLGAERVALMKKSAGRRMSQHDVRSDQSAFAEHLLQAPRAILTSGSAHTRSPVEELGETDDLTHVKTLKLDELPRSIAIIGVRAGARRVGTSPHAARREGHAPVRGTFFSKNHPNQRRKYIFLRKEYVFN